MIFGRLIPNPLLNLLVLLTSASLLAACTSAVDIPPPLKSCVNPQSKEKECSKGASSRNVNNYNGGGGYGSYSTSRPGVNNSSSKKSVGGAKPSFFGRTGFGSFGRGGFGGG